MQDGEPVAELLDGAFAGFRSHQRTRVGKQCGDADRLYLGIRQIELAVAQIRVSQGQQPARLRGLVGSQIQERARARDQADAEAIDQIMLAVGEGGEREIVQRAVRGNRESGALDVREQRHEEASEQALAELARTRRTPLDGVSEGSDVLIQPFGREFVACDRAAIQNEGIEIVALNIVVDERLVVTEAGADLRDFDAVNGDERCSLRCYAAERSTRVRNNLHSANCFRGCGKFDTVLYG